MVADFPRTLSLLRQEKKISQRAAAQALGVSQALLSHYENGVREPGLEFVVRVAQYYGVSCDYLLGKTMSRDGAAVYAEELPDLSAEKDNQIRGNLYAMLQKKLLINSTALFFDLIGKTSDRELIQEAASYLSVALYKAYRYVYMSDPENSEAVFSIPSAIFPDICEAEMKINELRLKCIALGTTPAGEKRLKPELPDMNHDALTRDYPSLSQALFTLLHTVSEKLGPRLK